MIYRRMHKQYNIIYQDQRQTGPNVNDYKEETFYIKSITITWNDHRLEYLDSEYSEVIESSNYFTIIDNSHENVIVLRYEDVKGFEFTMQKNIEHNAHITEQIVL